MLIDVVDTVTVAVRCELAGVDFSAVTNEVVVAIRVGDALGQLIGVKYPVKVTIGEQLATLGFVRVVNTVTIQVRVEEFCDLIVVGNGERDGLVG